METYTLKKKLFQTEFNGNHNGKNDYKFSSNCNGRRVYQEEIKLKSLISSIKNKVVIHKMHVVDVKQILLSLNRSPKVKMKQKLLSPVWLNHSLKSSFVQSMFAVFVLLLAMIYHRWDQLLTSRCAITNNYLVMEVTRPVTNCEICKNVNSFLILNNPSKELFSKYAYTGQPMVVKGSTTHWSALKRFNFEFFKKIYTEIPDAYQSVEEECQFFPFKTKFLRLDQVFSMTQSEMNMTDPNGTPWYIGWSNCNPDVAKILRQHYNRPTFLPDDSESSAIDWIFMGYSQQGAAMHLDYVQRPSWQAQISGSKSWHLLPPPECEKQCQPINITVHKGDIILIDTNQWYHDTHIEPGEISITIGSEYD